MNLNLGIQPWAFEIPNKLQVRRTTYTDIGQQHISDVNYTKMRKSNIRAVYPPKVGIVPADTRGLILENKPPQSSDNNLGQKQKTDKDYSEMISRNGKYLPAYPIVDKDHSRKVMASGVAVDDNIVNIPPTIDEMFALILKYKKDINASDYNYWVDLEQQYKKLMLLKKIRPLTDAENAIIERIRLLLIKELEKDSQVRRNSKSFNEILNFLSSIVSGGGAIYSAVKLAEILNTLSNMELEQIRNSTESVVLEDLNDINKLASVLNNLNKNQAQLVVAKLKALPNPFDIEVSAVGQPSSSAPGIDEVNEGVYDQTPSVSLVDNPTPIDVLSELTNTISSVGKTISEVGLQEPVKELIKSLSDSDFGFLKSALSLPDSVSRKNLYNSIINIDLTDIYNSISNIASTSPASLAGVAGLITSIVKSGGISKVPEVAERLQNTINLLPAPELLVVLQNVGLPPTSQASAVFPLLSTLGQSALWGLAMSLILTEFKKLYPRSLSDSKSEGLQKVKKQFGTKLMPVDFDPSKPNVMIKPDRKFTTPTDVGFQSGDVVPEGSWAITGADPVYMDDRPMPDLTEIKYEDEPVAVRTTSNIEEVGSPILISGVRKVFTDLNSWGNYQLQNKKRAYDLSKNKLKIILGILGVDDNSRDREPIITKIKNTINTQSSPDFGDETKTKTAKAVKTVLLNGSIKRTTEASDIQPIIDEQIRGEIPDISSDEELEEKKEDDDTSKLDSAFDFLDKLKDDPDRSPYLKVLKYLFTKLSIIKPNPLNVVNMIKVLKKYIDDPLLRDSHKIKQRNQLIQLIYDNGFNRSTTENDLNVIDNKRGLSSTHGTLRYLL